MCQFFPWINVSDLELTNRVDNCEGDVKRLLISDTGLQPSEMRLLFRGKEKEDGEPLHLAGVKDKAKLILVEDPAAREKKIQEQRRLDRIAQTCQAIGNIRGEVDKWAAQVCA